ncbi:MAG: Gfo/Idh/MocA family oxidoreductase [Chloroflexi bacterium]|nr:Gfo/Idh/MocA family oxidoreductase [Chloroflexota bacterium]
MSKVRVGFIGAGQIADLHARAYANNPTGELFAVADSSPGRAEARAAIWHADRSYEDYREMLADPDVDAVEILLPHFLHKEVAIAALEAGKHVSLQKPMGVDLAEADAISEAAAAADVVFRVFDNFLSYEPYRVAKRLIDEGEIGDPLTFRINVVTGKGVGGWEVHDEADVWRSNPAQSGGSPAIMDLGAHMAASIYFFMGPVERVHSFSDLGLRRGSRNSGSPAMITFKFEGESEGVQRFGSWAITHAPELQIPTDYYPDDEMIEIVGTRGMIWINRCSAKLLDAPPVSLLRDGKTRHFEEMEVDWGDSFRVGGEEFTDAIANGGQVDMSAKLARAVLSFQRAAILSAEEHREVAITEMG